VFSSSLYQASVPAWIPPQLLSIFRLILQRSLLLLVLVLPTWPFPLVLELLQAF
jgi:hypothetical protein